MRLHADFTERVVLHAPELDWVPSPMPGVHRRMLDRVGEEVARATSIVRYAPNSHFSAHVHGGGEEFLVLEGTFQDEHGDYPVGSYVRNPPTSEHTPRSEPGCVIFVKLWQFDPDDRHPVSLRLQDLSYASHADHSGVSCATLHEDAREMVEVQRWSAGTRASFDVPGGAEVLVLQGSLKADGDPLRVHSWMRLPAGTSWSGEAGADGATLWVKTGHLGG
ncbi:MAG: cupin domain-containing protein [Myxococcales bacterium]|nr:cupin domain-containing protein [Myxococcales bacterium]